MQIHFKEVFQNLSLLATTLLLIGLKVYAAPEISLKSSNCRVTVDPALLSVTLKQGAGTYPISIAQTNLGPVAALETNERTAQWQLPAMQATVKLELNDSGLLIHVLSAKPGQFTFPVIAETDAVRGWILPLFEGVYVPRGDHGWNAFLTKDERNTTADFTLPFIALDYGDATVTCLLTNQFNNTVEFKVAPDGHLQASLIHEFTRNHPVKEFGVLIQIGQASPIEPARLYRQWLINRGEFVSMAEKIRKTPETAKLPGAAHAYIWGEQLISVSDILNWKAFAAELLSQSAAQPASPAKRIWDLMQPPAKAAVTNLSSAQWLDRYTESEVIDDLNIQLLKRDFYDEAAWHGIPLDKQTAALLEKDRAALSQAELVHLNCALFAAAFPDVAAKPETWGDGISPKMIHQLAEAGFDRFWLGAGGWDCFVQRPETVEAAKKAGFLIGTYDSYNSIHHPKERDTWQTSQFDLALYESGGIVNADGSKRRGFKKKGYVLSPDAARPYVEKRVTQLMNIFHANSWFMDCDGFGEFFDDYSTNHPATQQSDMQSRIARLAWIRDTFGAVIGTEGCSAGIAPAVAFAHGVMTPVIGWGDPDLNNKKSQYYLGSYYPPEEPRVFFKPVPTKEEYRHLYFEPRCRLPLFQAVFHDSVVATHHWSFPSLKTTDQAKTVELLELAYNVPPLYHLNIQELQKRKAAIKRHYDFFSPMHRKTALLPLTEFKWLTPDHAVQQTTFGDQLDLVANFGDADFEFGTIKVAKGSIVAQWRDGKVESYTP